MALSGAGDVSIKDFVFGPAKLKLTACQPVTWTNVDDMPRQISVVGGRDRSGVILKGQSAKLQFDEAGNIAYVCGLHPGMKGTIEVVAK